jgi:hypothetical protein
MVKNKRIGIEINESKHIETEYTTVVSKKQTEKK